MMNPLGHVKSEQRKPVLTPRPNPTYPAFESLVVSKLNGTYSYFKNIKVFIRSLCYHITTAKRK